MNLLKDSQGKDSTKRLWGSILIGAGLIMGIIAFGISFLKAIPDPSMVKWIIGLFLGSGGGLLGVGVFEKRMPK